jgi:hypothetical protein
MVAIHQIVILLVDVNKIADGKMVVNSIVIVLKLQ